MFDDPMTLVAEKWIIVPVAFMAASVANATAIGGGFLFIPLFIYGYGLSPLVALKLTFATQSFGMTSGALGWGKRLIDGFALTVGGIASLLGMWVGSYYLQIPSEHIKPVFGWVSLFVFFIILLEIRYSKISQEVAVAKRGDIKLAGFLITTGAGGLITAWCGIGIGEFVVLYMLLVYKVTIEVSIATGVAMLALNSVLGFIFHSSLGAMPWEFLAFTVPGAVLGGFFGARFGKFIENKFCKSKDIISTGDKFPALKYLFAVIILVDGGWMLFYSYVAI
ncbi:MAG: sulfite exporter TauE/SafE family protein [Pseudomonadales bacterium]